MELQLVTFMQAKYLKELGFPQTLPESETQIYFNDGALVYLCDSADYEDEHNNIVECFRAPTLELAAKWLREEKDFRIYVGELDMKKITYIFDIFYNGHNDDYFDNSKYKNYEEALSAGIDEAIKILKYDSKNI